MESCCSHSNDSVYSDIIQGGNWNDSHFLGSLSLVLSVWKCKARIVTHLFLCDSGSCCCPQGEDGSDPKIIFDKDTVGCMLTKLWIDQIFWENGSILTKTYIYLEAPNFLWPGSWWHGRAVVATKFIERTSTVGLQIGNTTLSFKFYWSG